ncbi:MAG: hypothetical protein ACTSPI_13605 [Candidatus Heimdallarchaeaceae archaeon]
MKDKHPERQPKGRRFYGCPPLVYRHPALNPTGIFKNYDELVKLQKRDLEDLSLDLDGNFVGVTRIKRVLTRFSMSLEDFKLTDKNSVKVSFDSAKYHRFARIYYGSAETDSCLVTGYEIAVCYNEFMIVHYISKNGERILNLRTNDEEYVESHRRKPNKEKEVVGKLSEDELRKITEEMFRELLSSSIANRARGNIQWQDERFSGEPVLRLV